MESCVHVYLCANTEKRQSIEQPLLFHPDEEKHCGKCHRKHSLCPDAVGSAGFLRLLVQPTCSLGRWTCYFPSLLLSMGRASDMSSHFWGSLLRLAHPRLDEGMPQSTVDPFQGRLSQPQQNQRSAMLVCPWRKAPYGMWMASQHSPSYPGVEPRAWGGGLQRRGVCQGDSTPPSVLPGPGSTDPGPPLPLLAFGPMFCPHFACSVATVS